MKKIPLYVGVIVAFGAVAAVVTIKYHKWQHWKVLLSETIDAQSICIEAEREECVAIPDNCWIRTSVSGNSSSGPFEEVFSGGWRLVVVSGRLSDRKEAGTGLIELGSKRLINGADISKQYYQFINGKLVLVRLEDHEGILVANDYVSPNMTIGPKIQARTAAEWENALRSSVEAEILAALTWLGAYHAEPSSRPVEYLIHEDLAMARLVEEVHGRPGVRQRIVELTKSSNPWIHEAAEWSKEPHYKTLSSRGGPPVWR